MLFSNHICFLSMLFLEFFSFMFFMSGLLMLWDDSSYYLEWVIFSLNGVDLIGVLLLDYMSCIFLSVVMFISGMVVMYSDEYMHGDKNIVRFIMVVLLFVFSMAMLIISPNMISILLGWDGLGLVSYVLVIYYNNERSSSSGMLTAMSNRVGDVFLLLAIAWMLNYGSWNFIFYVNCMYFSSEMTFLFWLVFLGAITKSAQIPFSAWLPAAMAAPTPVSALVHSSTLVTAGIYLMIRFFPLLSDEMLKVMMFVSLMTMLMSSLVANYEVDLKRIIALSTLSQLGLMMFSLSLGCHKLSFFHLLTHALFKSLLFLCAGVVIHGSYGYQDIRKMGGLVSYLPFTGFCMGLSSLALGGFPFMAGFYSKDMILEFMELMCVNFFSYFLMLFSVGLTMMYSIRMMYYSLFGESKIFLSVNFGESSTMSMSMISLGFGSIFGGSLISWLMLPDLYMFDISLLESAMVMSVIIFGGFFGYYMGSSKSVGQESLFSFFFGNMWFMPWLCGQFLINLFLMYGGKSYKMIDMGWSEELGSNGILKLMIFFSRVVQWLHNNMIYYYYMLFFIAVIFIMFL
uniref:NADH-ubiquinone oxidoreductase chain 5 n=1 Tax=Campodea fragilis TaxID=383857 RepID=Q0ZD11_9HEXA|nr:NADH dehydrogenase subunit 5 [Campodea fragilis]ABF49569.1 NADH dehydrogenase subunit 5 [Campodea fragilis]